MRKRWIRLIFLACFTLAMLVVIFVRRTKEPSCHGILLSEWVAIYNRREPGFELEAEEALSEIGTNALPYLIKWIGYEPPKWKTFLGRERDPGFDIGTPKRWIPRSLTDHPGRERAGEAMVAFKVLGSSAAPAIPHLLTLAKSANEEQSKTATISLGHIGTPAIPALMQLMSDPSLSSDARFCATRTLNDLAYSAMVWGNLGTNAATTLPLLITNLSDKDGFVAGESAAVLGTLKSQSETVVPALVGALRSTNSLVRARAAQALGEFRAKALLALPALTNALTDMDNDVRECATNSIRKIAPNALPDAPRN
jgi:hypothetical protein